MKQREQQLPVDILIPASQTNVDDILENQKESLIFHTAVIQKIDTDLRSYTFQTKPHFISHEIKTLYKMASFLIK